MNPIFRIDTGTIQRLDDTQARELVARLCKSELRSKDVSQSFVTWGGDQRAKDGGVDVRVDISQGNEITGYIPSDRCAFQVKAENFTKSKIGPEMAPKGKLRPAIVDLADSGGAYVIVSTKDDCSDSFLKDRVEAMAECISSHGLTGKVELDFYDARKIADWVEQQPAIANWVRHVLGESLTGWKPYGPWAYMETEISAEYLVDDRVKIFVPNSDDGRDVLSAIMQLRTDLSRNVSVRIVGLSGVGKTRLVQALFDDRVCEEQPALDSENVLYTDLSDNPSPQPIAMMEALVSDGADCIVVVDNCGSDVHQRLTEIAKLPGSKIKLVTIEYDIRDDLPEGTVCYRLEGSTDTVIKDLLKRHFRALSDNDLDKIAEFSDGNARVAYALAATSENQGELARLRDSDLFKRLFVQKNTENDELLRCAETASLLYSFDGENKSDDSELALLSALAEVSVATFTRHVAGLQRRGLVQQRGKWRAVLPHAISNRLAVQALENLPYDILVRNLIEDTTDRVIRSFSRRLGFLHEAKVAREMARKWLVPNGRLGELTQITELECQILSNIAPLDQKASLDAIERAIGNSDFLQPYNQNRYRIIRLTRSLAYEPELFDKAAEILIQLALTESENGNSNSAWNMLISLFYCHLSGTESLPEQRSKIVRELLSSPDEKRQRLGFETLKAALESWHFTSHFGFEFGARRRGYGWSPRTQDDIMTWYKPIIEIAVEVGETKTAKGREARVVLGESVRGLWVRAKLCSEVCSAAKLLSAVDGWPEGWLGTRRVLQWDKDRISKESLLMLENLEQSLAPHDLRAKIGAKILARGSFSDELDEEDDETDSASNRYRRAEKEAKELGRTAALVDGLLSELLPDLLHHSANNKVFRFGFGAGLELRDANSLIVEMRAIVEGADNSSISLLFLRGFISGWHESRPAETSSFLNEALTDEVWALWFAELQLQIVLDDIGYERLLTSLNIGKTSVWQYQYLAMGGNTDPLTVDQVLTLVEAIGSRPGNSFIVAIDVLAMVIFCSKEKDEDYRGNLAAACTVFLRDLDWSKIELDRGRGQHDLGEVLEFALAGSDSENEIIEILRNLVAYERSQNRSFSPDRKKLLTSFFKHYPTQTLDAVYIADEDGKYRTAIRTISDLDNDREETAIQNVPLDQLIEWCEISPADRYLFAARTCRLFENATSDGIADASSLDLTEAARTIFTHAKDKEAVLHMFIDRFQPRIWSGSLARVLQERLPLLAKLNPNNDEPLGEQIAEAEDALKKTIAAIETEEEAEERDQSGSFE